MFYYKMSDIEIKIVGIDKLHESINEYIKDNKINIVEYEDMKSCILKMIREGYLFNLDRDRLRDAMEDLTYMYSPNDDVNKDRVGKGLEYEYSDDEDDISDDDDDDDAGINLMNMMMKDPSFGQLMGSLSNMGKTSPDTEEKCPPCDKKEECEESEKPTSEEVKEEVAESVDKYEEKECGDCPEKESETPREKDPVVEE